jgi:putative ABC transport system permease protein
VPLSSFVSQFSTRIDQLMLDFVDGSNQGLPSLSDSLTMFRNYLRITLRHALRNKLNASFRLSGLVIAFFSFLVVALYLSWQLSFDHFHTNASEVYRVDAWRDVGGQAKAYAVVPPGVGPALKESFPEVIASARLSLPGRQLVKYKERTLRPNGFLEADATVFDVLSFSFVRGDKHALDQPASVVLTSSLAAQLFGDEDPLGKPLTFVERFGRILTVTAVIEDMPANSHMNLVALTGRYDLLDNAERSNADTWYLDAMVSLYVRLKPGTNPVVLAALVKPLLERNIPPREDGSEKSYRLYFQPITSIYFDAPLAMDFSRKGNRVYLYGFAFLSVFLMIIAIASYLNLSLAEMGARVREMGIRKVMGAARHHIMGQTLVEGSLFAITALILGLAGLYVAFPEVKRQLEPNLSLGMLTNPALIGIAVLMLVLMITITSMAPALLLSRQTPALDLKGDHNSEGGKRSNVLLLVQVSIALLCLAVTWVMSLQMDFVRNTDLGYDRHQVVALLMPDRYPVEKAPTLKAKLASLAGVTNVSFSYYMITGGQYQKGEYRVEVNGEMKSMMVNEAFVDHDFLRTMEIPLIEGRNFDIANGADARTAFIVNEAAAKEFGWDQPIGKRISVGQSEDAGAWQGTVVGVTRDFNIRPLRERIEPLIMRLQFDNWPGYWLNVKVSGPMDETLAGIKQVFEEVLPGFIADYRLLDDLYDRQYQQEAKAFTALKFGTLMVALISALGVFSLSMYLSMRRTREFGIRKVLGASTAQILALHLKRFVRIAILANVLAIPLAWWLMSRWLRTFAYRTPAGAEVFLAVGGLGLLLLLAAAAYAALRATRVNPIDAIRRN